PLRRVHRPVRLAAVGHRPAREPVRLRLRVGGLLPAGEAPLGLLRAADLLWRPVRRPDRTADRPRPNPRAGARRLVAGRLRAGPRRGVRRGDARRAPRVLALRQRRTPRVGTPPRNGEAALPHPTVTGTSGIRVRAGTPNIRGRVTGTRPPSMSSNPDRQFSSVVLPDPDGPSPRPTRL